MRILLTTIGCCCLISCGTAHKDSSQESRLQNRGSQVVHTGLAHLEKGPGISASDLQFFESVLEQQNLLATDAPGDIQHNSPYEHLAQEIRSVQAGSIKFIFGFSLSKPSKKNKSQKQKKKALEARRKKQSKKDDHNGTFRRVVVSQKILTLFKIEKIK